MPKKNQANGRTRAKVEREGYPGLLDRLLRDPRKVSAAYLVSMIAAAFACCAVMLAAYMGILMGDLPSLSQIQNPDLELATVAYTADGVELARYGRQNRSWIAFDDISPHVKDALIATEDHRFYRHWGMDLFRTASAAGQSMLWKLGLPFNKQGGSTITQQLARNLYNEQIGFAVSVERKLKEMATAVQLERRYSKPEIIEMYLNTVPFRHNAYGIEATARTYFGKSARELDVLESAAVVGMLKATFRYDPIRNPELSRQRRNVVMRQMVKHDVLDPSYLEAYKDSLTTTRFRSADVTQSFAPYFAEHVRKWLTRFGQENNMDVYGEGLVVHTTLDSRLQTLAQDAVAGTMDGLQAVVECEWSASSSPRLTYGEDLDAYLEGECHKDPEQRFAYFWNSKQAEFSAFIRESSRYQELRASGVAMADALAQLRGDAAFVDSLKTEKTRLESGLVSVDPRTGHIKAWVGGRNLEDDWYDHVSIARRQPGSTFKPFLYSAAIDAGFSPAHLLTDSLFEYEDPYTGDIWSPQNSGGGISGETYTLREGLARSLNTISGQLILLIKPATAAKMAVAMGISSPLEAVPSLALGTSDVSLLELATGYSTLANLGIRNDPVFITRVEDKEGRVIYEAEPTPQEALSDITSAVVIDMMRDVINQGYGTGYRIRSQYRLDGYDFAGKTGTTQEGADGWFMLMHPELVTGAWVGFNDRRVTFRSSFWGQGAHNALFLVGDYLARVNASPDVELTKEERFPSPEIYGYSPMDPMELGRSQDENRRVGW